MLTKTLILTSTYPSELSPPDENSHHRLRRRFTLSLHIASLVTSLIGISLFSAAIPRWNANFFHNSGPNRGDWTDGFSLAPLTIAFIYHAGVLAYDQVQKRRQQTPLAPSLTGRSLIVHTAIPIVVLTLLVPALFIAGYGSLFRFWRSPVRTQSGLLVCNMLNVFARECEPVLYTVGSLQIAGIVFSTLLWVLHFVLLMIALRDVRRQRLVKQLQQEKLAQYDSASEKSSGRRFPRLRGHSNGSVKGSARSNSRAHGSGDRIMAQGLPSDVIQQPRASHTRTPS